MTRHETAAILALIKAAYGRFDVTDETVGAWTLLLDDIAGTLGLEATIELIREERWPPAISMIRERALTIRRRQLEHEASERRQRDDRQLEPHHITEDEWNELKAQWEKIGLLRRGEETA